MDFSKILIILQYSLGPFCHSYSRFSTKMKRSNVFEILGEGLFIPFYSNNCW